MKLGIFSDIHGNLPAFERIYHFLKKESCDRYLFLGDICGYYFQQNEVIDILREIPNLSCLAGNHDVLFLSSYENPTVMENYTGRFGKSFEILKDNLTSENLDFLKHLPLQIKIKEEAIACFHGSPWSFIEEYVYLDADMERFDSLPYKAVFLGHTHRPMEVVRKNAGEIKIINPGSVGQPRDGGWPSFAIYDTETRKSQIKRVKFNIDAIIDDTKRRNDPNPYLLDVMMRIKNSNAPYDL